MFVVVVVVVAVSGNAEFAAILNASFSAVVRGCPSWEVNVIDADLACDDKRMVQYRFVASVLCWGLNHSLHVECSVAVDGKGRGGGDAKSAKTIARVLCRQGTI